MIESFNMGASVKLSILLADEDALRRDGLSAVLSGNFEVISSVADGESALTGIRTPRPDVAVIDLNLPRVHGIELIRRVRAESLATKIVIMSSTDDADIVREAVRAGVDGYLLKNGPSRHLIDAISYVHDGGQYFSPQLGRDGRDRHLLQEPARTAPAGPRESPSPDSREMPREVRHDEEGRRDQSGDDEGADREEAAPRPGRSTRRSEPRTMRQRLREDTSSSSMNDRDYEIMSAMADGIRPILDKLEEIDSRVAMMESGDVEIPGDPRTWLSTELAQTIGMKNTREAALSNRSVDDFEARLPQLIDEAVTKRFSQMAGKLQQEIEETHVRTMESFVKNVQVKLVQRVTALEHDMSRQAATMNQLREYSQRTEENLGRLISGVDRLAQDLPRRLAAAKVESEAVESEDNLKPAPHKVKRRSGTGVRIPKGVWAGLVGLVMFGLVGWGIVTLVVEPPDAPASESTSGAQPEGDGKGKVPSPGVRGGAVDTKTKIQAAQEAMDHKDYAVAEDVYRTVLKTEPNNVEAIKGLASVLFREDKTEEAAEILDKLPKD